MSAAVTLGALLQGDLACGSLQGPNARSKTSRPQGVCLLLPDRPRARGQEGTRRHSTPCTAEHAKLAQLLIDIRQRRFDHPGSCRRRAGLLEGHRRGFSRHQAPALWFHKTAKVLNEMVCGTKASGRALKSQKLMRHCGACRPRRKTALRHFRISQRRVLRDAFVASAIAATAVSVAPRPAWLTLILSRGNSGHLTRLRKRSPRPRGAKIASGVG
jgi:hypothetical protein